MRDIILNIIYIFITGCGVVLVKYVVDLINKKIDELQVNTKISEYEQLNKYVDSAQQAISNAVLTVSQTYVDSLKASNSFNKEAQETAKNKAVEIANELITEESKNAIIVLYGDFNVYVDSCIESMVKENKK